MNKQLVCKNLLISYTEQAEQNSQASLLFLHGWRSNKEIWSLLTTHSSFFTYRRIALDLPGFGLSQIPTSPLTVGDYAEIVAEFIKKLELENFIIVGHSFGGRVGIKLAANYPELVSKLVLVDSAGFAMDESKKSAMNAAAKIVKPFFKPKFMQGLRKKIYKHIGAEDYVATPQLQKTFVNITSEDLTEDMKKIFCPTLIVNGENDQDTPVEFGKKMHSLILNSSFLILPNAGHFSFLDQPQNFINELKEFIK